jgi:hypothetical protein
VIGRLQDLEFVVDLADIENWMLHLCVISSQQEPIMQRWSIQTSYVVYSGVP